MTIPFVDLSRIHRPLETEFFKAVQSVIHNNAFILGEDVSKFEKTFSSSEGANHGIGVANGTDAILLALKACGIRKGDEVILPSHTFISTALAVTYAGGTPMFADIEEDSYTLDPLSVEKRITKKTKAILPVSLYGQPPNISALMKLAKAYNLYLILDNAQAHGATYKNKPLGLYGHACCYSFYPGKNLGAFGDGGILITNSSRIARRVSLLRNIGRTAWYHHAVKGYNSRLDTIQAAILSVKLNHLHQWTKERQMIAKRYEELLQGLPIILPKNLSDRTHVFHLYVIRVKNRNDFMKYLEEHGIQTSIHYPVPIHKQPAYKEYRHISLPVTEQVAKEVVSLPFFIGMTEQEQEYVAHHIQRFLQTSKSM